MISNKSHYTDSVVIESVPWITILNKKMTIVYLGVLASLKNIYAIDVLSIYCELIGEYTIHCEIKFWECGKVN